MTKLILRDQGSMQNSLKGQYMTLQVMYVHDIIKSHLNKDVQKTRRWQILSLSIKEEAKRMRGK